MANHLSNDLARCPRRGRWPPPQSSRRAEPGLAESLPPATPGGVQTGVARRL